MTIEQIDTFEQEEREKYTDAPHSQGMIKLMEICELARAELRQRQAPPTKTKSSHYLLRFLPCEE